MPFAIPTLLLGLCAAGLLAACTSVPERDWMKVNQPYTVAEFRRDHAACTKNGKLDDACMRTRGWVDVSRPAEKAPEPPRRAIAPRAQ
jgi:hypothetical protein